MEHVKCRQDTGSTLFCMYPAIENKWHLHRTDPDRGCSL